jgi:hypothetical protein
MAMARRLVTPRGHRPLRVAQPGTLQPSSGSRMPGSEGLRAIAAGSVFIYHCWLLASPSRIPPKLGLLTWVMPHLSLGEELTANAFPTALVGPPAPRHLPAPSGCLRCPAAPACPKVEA